MSGTEVDVLLTLGERIMRDTDSIRRSPGERDDVVLCGEACGSEGAHGKQPGDRAAAADGEGVDAGQGVARAQGRQLQVAEAAAACAW